MYYFLLCAVSLVPFNLLAQVRTEWTFEEQAFNKKVAAAVDKAIPERLEGLYYGSKGFQPTPAYTPGFDSLAPFPYVIRVYYSTDSTEPISIKRFNEEYADVTIFINPKENIDFEVTRDFKALSHEGVLYGIRGSQRFIGPQGSWYDGPFTALLIGAFTVPNNRNLFKRAKKLGPHQFITTTAYTSYDTAKLYTKVQGIYILIAFNDEYADKIINRINFAALNELIDK